mgnify:CR=1 FL=1
MNMANIVFYGKNKLNFKDIKEERKSMGFCEYFVMNFVEYFNNLNHNIRYISKENIDEIYNVKDIDILINFRNLLDVNIISKLKNFKKIKYFWLIHDNNSNDYNQLYNDKYNIEIPKKIWEKYDIEFNVILNSDYMFNKYFYNNSKISLFRVHNFNKYSNMITNINRDKNKLLYVSSAHKGLDTTIKYFNALNNIFPDLKLYICNPSYFGLGYWDNGWNKIEINNTNIIYLGRINNDELQKHYSDSRYLFQLNSRVVETFGNVYLEAMTFNLPVISYNIGPVNEIVSSNNLLINPDNSFENNLKIIIDKISKNNDELIYTKNNFEKSYILDIWNNILFSLKTNVFAIKLHWFNEHIVNEIIKIYRDISHNSYIIILFDQTRTDFEKQIEKHQELLKIFNIDYELERPINTHTIVITDDNNLKKINNLHLNNEYNLDSCLINLYRKTQHLDIKYYWQTEYDIRFNGDYNFLYNNIGDCDYLANEFRNDYEKTKNYWWWWNNLDNWSCDTTNLVRCLTFFIRISKKFMHIINENAGIKSGFCELYFSTLCKNSNLTYDNIPQQIKGNPFHFSNSKPEDYYKELIKSGKYHNCLFHPIKNTDKNISYHSKLTQRSWRKNN